MPWVEQPRVNCIHPSMPVNLTSARSGHVWECSDCGKRFRVKLIDYGHDVQQGEPSSEYVFVPINKVP